ncbi:hypothetical protein [Pseudobdellovibrio sp. HCB154]|uniref:hypothetical protein n=1 Tax=Pseudobdellovibrio sp. HCB154 TaxID=3386277 RepID=UPI003916FD9C
MKTTLTKLLVLFVVLATQSVFAGGDRVNNGGGLAEKNVIYAYEKLESYIKLCLVSDTCKLNPTQQFILQKIYDGLPSDKNSTQLSFSSERANPGRFIIDGNVRVAKTGSLPGSAIMINVDLLYNKNQNGSYEAMSIPEAVAVLVHEFGHHYGNYSHEELDLIGVRVSLLLQSNLISTPLVPWRSDISMTVLNQDASGAFPDVLLYVGNDIIDISRQYKAEIECVAFKIPIPLLPLPDIKLNTKTPKGSIFHNLHWDKIKDSETTLDVQITGNVSNRCKVKSDTEIRNNSAQLSIKFRMNKSIDTWIYDPQSLSLRQFEEQWWKIIKLPNLPN